MILTNRCGLTGRPDFCGFVPLGPRWLPAWSGRGHRGVRAVCPDYPAGTRGPAAGYLPPKQATIPRQLPRPAHVVVEHQIHVRWCASARSDPDVKRRRRRVLAQPRTSRSVVVERAAAAVPSVESLFRHHDRCCGCVFARAHPASVQHASLSVTTTATTSGCRGFGSQGPTRTRVTRHCFESAGRAGSSPGFGRRSRSAATR